jgi:Ca2+-binding RTX toxin-like protein
MQAAMLRSGLVAGVAVFAALAAAHGAALKGTFMPIECSSPAGTLSVESLGHLREEVTVGYRATDNALRVQYFGASKDEGPFEFDVTCPDPGTDWRLITMKLGSGGDLVKLDAAGTGGGFREVPATIKAMIDGQGTVDMLMGHAGVDVLKGGSAFDELTGFEGADVLVGGGNQDRMLGGRGSDLIKARDGGRQGDIVLCGRGRDKVIADKPDKLRGCEKVKRN